MKTLTVLSVTLVLIACFSSPRTAVGPGNRVLGTFAYSADLGSRKEIGSFSIEPDTVTVDSDQALCRRQVQHEVDERIHNFDCVGVEGTKSMVLVIDSRSPMSSTWYGTRGVTKTRSVCVQYATKSTGETYCAAYATEAYESSVGISGPLHVASVKAN
jgi:hypothetical protein